MSPRVYHLLPLIAVVVVLGASGALDISSEDSPFPDSNQELAFDKNEEAHFYGKKANINGTEFMVYGPYQAHGENYSVVRHVETGSEKVYTNGSSPGLIKQIIGVENKVKGVKSLYIETRLDPLLYSGYSDDLKPEQFNDYGERLLTSGPHEWTNQSERDLIYEEGLEGNNLLAHRFLRSLTEVRDRTNNFYEAPSYGNSKSLIESYERAQESYQKDLQDQINIYTNLADRRSEDELETWVTQSGKTISFQTILEDLRKVNKNSEALKEEIERRKEILGNNREISVENRILSKLSPGLESEQKLESFYSKEDLEEVYRKRLDVGQKLVTSEEIEGPYDVKVTCLEENHLVTRAENPRSYPNHMITDSVARRINYTDRQYYSEGFPSVRTEGEGEKFSPDGFNATGTLMDSDMVFTYCPCPYYDITGMYWELIDKTYSKINSSPILQNIDETEVKEDLEGYENREKILGMLKEGKEVEQMFIDYPSQKRLEVLGNYYKELYKLSYVASKKGYPVSQIQENSTELQKTFSLIKGKIGAIQRPLKKNYLTDNGARGYMYTEAMYFETINESNFYKVFDEMDVLRHSATRLTFLPDSSSVWRTNETLDYYSEEEKLPLWVTYTPED